MNEKYPNDPIEEAPGFFITRRKNMLHAGVLLVVVFWAFLLMIYFATSSFVLPGSIPLSPLGTLVFAIVLPMICLAWIGVLITIFPAWQAARLRLTEEGIEMPELTFREWLAGERMHLARWQDLSLVHLHIERDGRWGIVLAEGATRTHRFQGSWFGPRMDAALRLLIQRVRTRRGSE